MDQGIPDSSVASLASGASESRSVFANRRSVATAVFPIFPPSIVVPQIVWGCWSWHARTGDNFFVGDGYLLDDCPLDSVRILRSQIDSRIGLGHEGSRELERGTDQAVFFPGIQGARHRSIWFRRESDLFFVQPEFHNGPFVVLVQ